jgi:uncharacterized protein (TIGR03790 family)
LALALALVLLLSVAPVQAAPDSRRATGITPRNLAVVINTNDPLSVQIGEYYASRRHVPQSNIARVHFGYRRALMTSQEFMALKAAIDAQLPAAVQAYALTWVRPYRVDCMSMTSAFAFGFDASYCANGCVTTQLSRYFNSDSTRPFDDLQMRPAMILAATTLERARALIDRGVASDGTAPRGTAYLLTSGDAARDVRASRYGDAQMLAGEGVAIEQRTGASISGRRDVMFYFIGAVSVPDLDSNTFLPGSVADHLTSYGGALTEGSQMSSLRWLEAGAGGSYGTVVEPCNITAKFPHPGLLMRRYLRGETLIEAYWKSVAMPGQGLFIGEPLSAPYRLPLECACNPWTCRTQRHSNCRRTSAGARRSGCSSGGSCRRSRSEPLRRRCSAIVDGCCACSARGSAGVR